MAKAFNQAAMGRFGSGWAWLGVTPEGSLAVTSTANQDNPLMEGSLSKRPVKKVFKQLFKGFFKTFKKHPRGL